MYVYIHWDERLLDMKLPPSMLEFDEEDWFCKNLGYD
jgi:hypothetical protein